MFYRLKYDLCSYRVRKRWKEVVWGSPKKRQNYYDVNFFTALPNFTNGSWLWNTKCQSWCVGLQSTDWFTRKRVFMYLNLSLEESLGQCLNRQANSKRTNKQTNKITGKTNKKEWFAVIRLDQNLILWGQTFSLKTSISF